MFAQLPELASDLEYLRRRVGSDDRDRAPVEGVGEDRHVAVGARQLHRLAAQGVAPTAVWLVIRPIEPEDAGELQRGLEHLSALTAFRRFRAHVRHVSREQLEHLTRIDHVRHEALIALEPESGSVVGVVRYVCDPADPSQAEITYVVADAWQHRGVGSALIDRLAARARTAGVTRFIATTLAVDARARRLLVRVAAPISERDADGILETTARLRRADEHPRDAEAGRVSPQRTR